MQFIESLQNGNTLYIVKSDDLTSFAIKLLAEQPKPQPISEIEQPITQGEAAKFIKRSRPTLIKWRKEGIITAHHVGGRVYYLKSELLAAIRR